jgi:carbamate kinase
MLTDVDSVQVGWGTPSAAALRRARPSDLRGMRFAAGSMAPKVEAACRFVERTCGQAGIGRLDQAAAVLAGRAGTMVSLDAAPSVQGPVPA